MRTRNFVAFEQNLRNGLFVIFYSPPPHFLDNQSRQNYLGGERRHCRPYSYAPTHKAQP